MAGMPDSPGMSMSMSATSGMHCWIFSMVSKPLSDSPTMLIDSMVSKARRKPMRSKGWSSAMKTVIG